MIVNNFNCGFTNNNSIEQNKTKNLSFGSLRDDARDTFIKNHAASAVDSIDDIPTPVLETAQNCAVTAKNIKKHYDNLYGKDNWEYISIGRSCSRIADCINALGTNAATIPISNLTNGVQNGQELCLIDGFNEFKNFIYGLGLDPDTVKNSPKKYIFQDFCDSGKSLKRFEEFIRSKEMGLDCKNVIFESINSVFENIFKAKEVDFEDFKKMIDFNSSLSNQSTIKSIKTYTNIKKLPPDKLKTIVNGIIDTNIRINPDFETALKHFIKSV